MVRAAVAAALLLAAAPAAHAARTPPPKPAVFHLRSIHLAPHGHRATSCSAQARSRQRVARTARKIVPVACEQPPRSHQIGLDPAKQIAAAAASALAP